MFRKLLQASAPEVHFSAPAEEQNDSPARPPAPGSSERNRKDSFEHAKLSSFEDIYFQSSFKAATSTAAWDILKVADMISSPHLHGLSPAGKHSALMMALEAAGVAVEDMLHDAVQRQRVLNEYEDGQRKRLEDFQTAKQLEKERLCALMEAMCSEYRMRIAYTEQDVERERALFREWQERKEKEHRRISEAA